MVERYEAIDVLVLAAEAAAELADMHRARAESRLATAAQQRAADIAERAGGLHTPALARGDGIEPLTAREREVALLAAAGRSSRDIGDRLGLSTRTVDTHLARVYRKLGIAGRSELAAALGDVNAVDYVDPRAQRIAGDYVVAPDVARPAMAHDRFTGTPRRRSLCTAITQTPSHPTISTIERHDTSLEWGDHDTVEISVLGGFRVTVAGHQTPSRGMVTTQRRGARQDPRPRPRPPPPSREDDGPAVAGRVARSLGAPPPQGRPLRPPGGG